jgi:hypothetical protein
MLDLFGQNDQKDFYWIVAMFTGCGASDVIKRANGIPLQTYYPLRLNKDGNMVPLWRNYLFIEFKGRISVDICRSTYRFLKFINIDKIPILVPKNAINSHLELLNQGKFDEKTHFRRFHGRGALITVIDGNFANKRVRLEADIPPNLPGNKLVPVSIGNWSGKIELFKLAL